MKDITRRPAKPAAAALLLILPLILTSCLSSPEPEKFYYTLRYIAPSENPELIQNEPIEGRVWVRTAAISRTYKRKQIVLRHFGPRISYLENHLWANDLEDKIPELVAARLQKYRLFGSIQRDFPYSRPEYELLTTITALEFIRDGGTTKAALSVRFDLRSLQGSDIVSTELQREVPVYDRSLDSFVQVVNETILEYADLFARDVLAHFGRAKEREAPSTAVVEERMGSGRGQLLMPGLFEGREPPAYVVIGEGGAERIGRFGTPLELSPGIYTVRYGTGPQERRMQRTVRVREGSRTIVEPDYGGLRVEILTPEGRPVELPYELFDDATGRSYGTGYSNDRSSALEDQIWVLPVGRYKVTINNRPFNATLDYAAAYVERGKGNILTVSVTEVENSGRYEVAGGGVIKEPLYTDERERWILASSVAGNVAGTFDTTDSFADYTAGYTLNGYLQNRLRYDYDRLDLSLQNLVEVGLVRTETGAIEARRDALEFDSIMIVDLVNPLGLYGNFDLSTHFLDTYYRSDTPFDYEKRDAGGNLISQEAQVESVQTAPPFMPISFQEGAGLNLTIAEGPRIDASGRAGLGLRQTLYGDSFAVVDTSTDPIVLQRKENELSTGLETSLQLSTELLRNLVYTTRFDAYAPFTDFEDVSLEWFHELQLALIRNFSIDYRATFYNPDTSDGGFSVNSDQAVYLRFSTIYRLSF